MSTDSPLLPFDDGQECILRSEFGAVAIAIDREANGPRLRISNLDNDASICLDPLVLACLTSFSQEDFAPFVYPPQDPSPDDYFPL